LTPHPPCLAYRCTKSLVLEGSLDSTGRVDQLADGAEMVGEVVVELAVAEQGEALVYDRAVDVEGLEVDGLVVVNEDLVEVVEVTLDVVVNGLLSAVPPVGVVDICRVLRWTGGVVADQAVLVVPGERVDIHLRRRRNTPPLARRMARLRPRDRIPVRVVRVGVDVVAAGLVKSSSPALYE